MNKPASLTARRTVIGPDSLTLRGLLNELVKSGLINSAAARAVVEPPKRKDGAPHHPLVIAAAQEWPDRRNEGRKLTMEALTQWLARRVHLPYMRIDPLKLDVASLTELIPYAYALRSGILPIKSTPAGVVFAVKDPFAVQWMAELEPVLKVPLKRVLANPLDIDKYLVEFYAVARSVKATGEERSQGRADGITQPRAADRAQPRGQALRGRSAHRGDRRLAPAVRLRFARQRHSSRAPPRFVQRALSHRRCPARCL